MLASIAAGLAFHHLIERPLIRGFRALPGRLGQAQADPSR
jgi:peptidoglycan/LPS O-acetylase OafA/YrhL